MPSVVPGFEYDIFISYRQKDNKGDRWVTDFVQALKAELDATFKENLSIYFDENPHDGVLETHHVNKSLEGKLKCLVFIPIISQTYCDPKSFAWVHEFCAFNKLAAQDSFTRDVKLRNGNVASRILPIRIHDLDAEDTALVEGEIGGALRPVEFIFRSPGVNRPLRANEDRPNENQGKTYYRDQINKVANSAKEIISTLRRPGQSTGSTTKSEKSTSRWSEGTTKPLQTKTKILIAGAIVIVLLAFAGYYFSRNRAAGEGADGSPTSIAVLPFVNLSGDPEQEYFSDGITEQIITNLSHISSLKVIARTSVMKYKKTTKSAAEIGKELNVTYILEGSIRKAEGRIRVTVQLIKTIDETHIWSQDYDRKLADIFTIQDEISNAIVHSLQRKLTPREYDNFKTERSANIQAYEHCLKGYSIHLEQYSVKRLEEDFVLAEHEFKEAIRLDSGYAMAYASLADLYHTHSNFVGFKKEERITFEKKRDVCLSRAFKLSPNNPYILTLKAGAIFNKIPGTDADLDSTFMLQRRAFAIAPNNIDVCAALSSDYAWLGLLNQAIPLTEKCIGLDPTFDGYYSDLGLHYLNLGDYAKAEIAFQKALLLQPEGITNLQHWATIKLHLNDIPEAERAINKIKEINPEAMTRHLECYMFAKKGEYEKALSIFKAPPPYIDMVMGMHKEALDFMEQRFTPHYLSLVNMKDYDPLRQDPRFKALLVKAKGTYDERLRKYAN